MKTIFLSYSFFLLEATSIGEVDYKKCIQSLTNGCSLPWGIPWPYKKKFLPACLRHDVCYSCGSEYQWSREQCDVRFRKDMVFICYLNEHQLRYDVINWNHLWSKMKGVGLIAKGIFQWLFGKSGSLKHCLIGAKMYYDGVNHFSMDYFLNYPMKECHLPCAKILGDPNASITGDYYFSHLNRTFV